MNEGGAGPPLRRLPRSAAPAPCHNGLCGGAGPSARLGAGRGGGLRCEGHPEGRGGPAGAAFLRGSAASKNFACSLCGEIPAEPEELCLFS